MSSTFLSNLPLFSSNHPSINADGGRHFATVRCGPRSNRGPLVKGRVLSTEAIQAVQSLKRAASRADPSSLDAVLSKTLSRLIKPDLIAAFNELLRQDRCDLALKVFAAARSESWYATDLAVYADLVTALARKGMAEDIDSLIGDLETEGGIPCGGGLVRLVKAVIAAGRVESTARIYGLMKRSGWRSDEDEYVARVLSKGLRRMGELRLADEIGLDFGTS
ncbi:protein THYLAKOID ASSEMBLY 8, chloroplastic [Diospyros lotus]|uniref:protein THYLAKOID ASSEMBLY 8, chloroplastic n=1 Tax=Diospyros lotus TaxID=55363 RepID=UPI00224CDC05|nr:protein THYLAKOID ASSEMBLY 8, chloroplastic [Diospyros lotus]